MDPSSWLRANDTVDAAIQLHDGLYDPFPSDDLNELARQVRLLLAMLSLMGEATAVNYEAAILRGLMEAWSIGWFESKADPGLTDDLKAKFDAMFLKSSLLGGLKAMLGLKACVVHGFNRKGYRMVVMSCLGCGAHKYSFPKDHLPVAIFMDFCHNHSECAS